MALVEHVFANGVQGVELPSFSVAVDADVSDRDLFCEVVDEAGDVDEVIGVGDEEGVGGGHVGEVIREGRGRGCAEEARELWVVGFGGGGRGRGGLGRAGCAVDQVFLVPFRAKVGSVGILRGICLSAGGGYMRRRRRRRGRTRTDRTGRWAGMVAVCAGRASRQRGLRRRGAVLRPCA